MFFKYAGSKTKSRTRIGPLVDDKGNVVDNDNVTAEMFNAYFASVFTKEREAVPDAVNMCNNDQEGLKNFDLSPQKVMEVLTQGRWVSFFSGASIWLRMTFNYPVLWVRVKGQG